VKSILLVAVFLSFCSAEMKADSECSATNDNGDQTCSISCPAGQAATCSNGVGSSPPTCYCAGTPEGALKKNFGLSLLDSKRFDALDQPPKHPALENTNVIEVVNAKLATLPSHHITDVCHLEVRSAPTGGPGGEFGPPEGRPDHPPRPPVTTKVCQPVVGKLTIQPPLIVVVAPVVSVSEPNWKDIPTDVFMQHATYHNCSSAAQSQTFQHNQQLSVGDTVTKTKALQTGSSQSISIHAGFKVKILDFSGTDTLTVNTQATVTDTNTETHTEQQQNSVTVPLNVPAMTDLQIRHSFVQYRVPVPFTGVAILDAQIAPNLDGIVRLSQVLPNEADRKFEFAGVVSNSTLVDAATATSERKLTAPDCSDGNGRMTLKVETADHF